MADCCKNDAVALLVEHDTFGAEQEYIQTESELIIGLFNPNHITFPHLPFDTKRLTEYPRNNITQLPTSQYYIFCILACEFYFDHPMVYER